MSQSRQTSHKVLTNLALPYVSWNSPVSTDPLFESGLNILTNSKGMAELRPGFNGELTTSSHPWTTGTVSRIFTWQKWNGDCWVIICVTGVGTSAVYACQPDISSDWTLVHNCATSGEPFSFVVAGNTLYMGNGKDMRKWDGTTATNWGIAAPTSSPSVATAPLQSPYAAWSASTFYSPSLAIVDANGNLQIATTGGVTGSAEPTWATVAGATTADGTVVWTNNGSATWQAGHDYVLDDVVAASWTYSYEITVFDGYSYEEYPYNRVPVYTTETVTGTASAMFRCTRAGTSGATAPAWDDGLNLIVADGGAKWQNVGAIKHWADIGATTKVTLEQSYVDANGNKHTVAIPGKSGATEPTWATVKGSLTADGTVSWACNGPFSVAVSTVGYKYVYCYANTTTGHVSSPSPLSDQIGITLSSSVAVQAQVSPDPQVDEIRFYRTTDGGVADPAVMRLVGTVSVTAGPTTFTFRDQYSDEELLDAELGPGFYTNDPPPPMKNLCWSQGRIWGSAGSKTYFSGAEEITTGVTEECFPSGDDGNYYTWDLEVTGQSALPDGVAVYLPNKIWKIEGDSLDTFRKYKLLDKRGTRAHQSIAAVDSSVAWLDTAGQIWLSDTGEVGKPIRPDAANMVPAATQIAIHISGTQHWLVVMDGTAHKLFVYDLDTAQWMPPWYVAGITAIWSGETSAGKVELLAAVSGKVVRMNPATFTDLGVPYAAFGVTNLWDIAVPGNPENVGWIEWLDIETNQHEPSAVKALCDDDPDQAEFTQLSVSTVPSRRKQGTYILDKQYKFQPASTTPCRRASFRLEWAASGVKWQWLSLDVVTMNGWM